MENRNWKTSKLGDLVEILSSRRVFYSDYVESGIPFYRSKEVIDFAQGNFYEPELFISKEKFEELTAKNGYPLNGDILISAVGERAGIPYVVKNLGEFYFKDGNVIWIKSSCELSNDYLSYWLKSFVGIETLNSLFIGSAQKALTIIGLKNIEIQLPPL
ncbi:MAG: restriction endonuclease subunit S, partial [Kurthia sp.]|nr:restriction endonuclease subunit S [Candidatus Kurthia equi]